MTPSQTHSVFEATRWSIIGALGSSEPGVRQRAVELVGRLYWGPVYARLRKRGKRPEEAADLTQAFFTDVIVGRRLLERARPDRGRVRTLILTALDRFVIDGCRRAGREVRPVPIELMATEEARMGECGADAFDRRWALAVLEEAVARCRGHFVEGGREGHWRAFEARVLSPAISGCEARPLVELARELGRSSPADVASMVQVVKERLIATMSAVLAENGESEGVESLRAAIGS